MKHIHPHKLTKAVFVSSIGALLIATALYAYLYYEASSLIGKVSATTKLIRASEATRGQSKDILTEHAATAGDRSRLVSLFVPVENEVAFIKATEAIQSESGADVAIASIRSAPPDEKAKAKVGSVSATVTVRGSWTAVMRALELFESFPYKSSLGTMSLAMQGSLPVEGGSKAAPSARAWQLSFDMTAATLEGAPSTTAAK